MKRFYLILLAAIVAVFIHGSLSFAENGEDYLPIGFTEEELTRLDEIGINHVVTAPPTGKLRNCAEWEPSEGVIIRWPLGISISLVAELSRTAVVWTICSSDYYKNQAISSYQSGGVNMDSTEFIIAATNTFWTRDYGPWFIFRDQTMEIVDPVYNRPRPQDDVIPQTIGTLWGMAVYGMDLTIPGGNHMSDGLGMSMSTELVLEENPGKTADEIDSIILAYLGNDYTVLDYIESGGIHHIDCWAKFLNPTTILVKSVPVGDPSYTLLNARANWLSTQISPWGEPYTIVRIYCPSGTAYTNSLILNNKVFVPIFGSSWDDDAIQTYEDAMPGYEVYGFTGSFYDNDAIHCRTMGVPDREMLFVDHRPLHDTGDTENDRLVSVHIEACSGAALIPDSLKVYYSVNSGAFVSTPLYSTAVPDSFYGYLPAQGPGAEVRYFVRAADLSGRVEDHPFIGGPWAHIYHITAANQPPVLAEIGAQEVDEGANLYFIISATDPDSTIPTLLAEDIPVNATFINNGDGTGTFDFTPDNSQSGEYYVRFIATDGSLADTELVTITVNDINQPPTIIDPDTLLCRTEEYFSYYPEIIDPDDTTHQVTYSMYPGWMTVINDSLTGTPTVPELVTFRVRVSDGVNYDSLDILLIAYLCGDADSSDNVDIDDVVSLIEYIFSSGDEPFPIESGDVNCADGIDIDDVVYLITYIFTSGPWPCADCQ